MKARRDLTLDEVHVIRENAPRGMDVVLGALGRKISRGGVTRAANRHGIVVAHTVAAVAPGKGHGYSGMADRAAFARVAARRNPHAGSGHNLAFAKPNTQAQAFNPSFGGQPKKQAPNRAAETAAAFRRESADGLVPLLELAEDACRWPYEVNGEKLFCAQPRVPGKRYCAACAAADAERERSI